MRTSSRLIALAVLVLAGGCASIPSSEELQLWKDQSAALTRDIAEVEIQLGTVSDPAQRAGLEMRLKQMKVFSDRLDQGIKDAKTAGEAREAGLDALLFGLGGMIPGFALAIPLIKRGFSVAGHLMKSVEAGGGVKNGAAASKELMKNPAALAAFNKFKNGTVKPA